MPKIKVEKFEYICDYKNCEIQVKNKNDFRNFKDKFYCDLHFEKLKICKKHEWQPLFKSSFDNENGFLRIARFCKTTHCFEIFITKIDIKKQQDKFLKFIEECEKDD